MFLSLFFFVSLSFEFGAKCCWNLSVVWNRSETERGVDVRDIYGSSILDAQKKRHEMLWRSLGLDT
jgi:hypothetical protein